MESDSKSSQQNIIDIVSNCKRLINYDTINVELAKFILNNLTIKTGETEYNIREIEFYLYSENHTDECVHKSPNQKLFMSWYIHKTPNDTFKSGTYKGLDLTFGNGTNYYGVLIRSITNINTDQLIAGPCCVVNELLEKANTSLSDIKTNYLNDLNKEYSAINFPLFRIAYNPNNYNKLFTGERIGLKRGFINCKYRFTNINKKIKAVKTLIVLD